MAIIQRRGDFKENFSILNVNISLLASYDGTEILHHQLTAGSYWSLRPDEDWRILEYIYVLSGKLRVTSSTNKVTLIPGDSFSATPLTDFAVFRAETDVEFLYIASRSISKQYGDAVFNLQELAVSVEQKDGYTSEHCHRIMNLSMRVAEELKLSPKDQHDLLLGSFLHDLGKVQIPNSILNKLDRLSPDEWEVMKQHPLHSSSMIQNTGLTFMKDIAVITLQHHERFDGSGYPYGLKGNEIHIGAAIVGVVDSFDAMTSDRIYRKAIPVEKAINKILQNRGKLYHPEVVDAFMRITGQEKRV